MNYEVKGEQEVPGEIRLESGSPVMERRDLELHKQ